MEQVYLTTNEIITATNEEQMTQPRSAEPKLAREERFESQSWEALRASVTLSTTLLVSMQTYSRT